MAKVEKVIPAPAPVGKITNTITLNSTETIASADDALFKVRREKTLEKTCRLRRNTCRESRDGSFLRTIFRRIEAMKSSSGEVPSRWGDCETKTPDLPVPKGAPPAVTAFLQCAGLIPSSAMVLV